MSDLENKTLMAWCHWKKREKPPASEDDLAMVKAIEDLHSQVGNYKARLEAAQSQLTRALKVIEVARGVGMNWKLGAPYGLDALGDAIKEFDGDEHV